MAPAPTGRAASGEGGGVTGPPSCQFSSLPPHPLPGDCEMLPPFSARPQDLGTQSFRGPHFCLHMSLAFWLWVQIGSRCCGAPASELETRFWVLGLVWGWLGLHSHCVPCLCEEPGNPKAWTNLVTPSSQHSHGPSELFLCFSFLVSVSPSSWLWCLSQRPQRKPAGREWGEGKFWTCPSL